MGFMSGSLKLWLLRELARNAAPRDKEKPWAAWTHCAGTDLEHGDILQRVWSPGTADTSRTKRRDF